MKPGKFLHLLALNLTDPLQTGSVCLHPSESAGGGVVVTEQENRGCTWTAAGGGLLSMCLPGGTVVSSRALPMRWTSELQLPVSSQDLRREEMMVLRVSMFSSDCTAV